MPNTKADNSVFGGSTRPIISAAGTPISGMTEEEINLTMMHMRKLFTDFTRSQLSWTEQEQRLYKILPLFHKITGLLTLDDLVVKFKEIVPFANHMSKLFVQEVRKRAAKQCTDVAAAAVLKFLEPSSVLNNMDQERGWLLLSALRILISTGSASVAETMCQASLPSTLAKSLYLFYDLPKLPDSDALSTAKEQTRTKLQDAFVELMTKLCGFVCAAEELTRKDDLSLLLSAASSWCAPHNISWRKATAEVLMTLSARALTTSVLSYLHNKRCVDHFLKSIGSDELSVPEKVDMIVCWICLLKDSSAYTSQLVDDFGSENGYQFLTDFLLRFESQSANEVSLRNLLLMLSSFTTVGYSDLKLSQQINTLYQLPGFKLPQPLGQGIADTVLDVISSIYCSDPANYFLLDPLCTLGQFADTIHLKPEQTQLLEYVVFHLNFVPSRELIALTVLVKTQCQNEVAILCMRSLFKILSYNTVFKDVFRDVGLFEVLIHIVRQFSNTVKDTVDLLEADHALQFLALDMLSVLIKGSASNAALFRECDGQKAVHALILNENTRSSALLLMQQLLLNPNSDDDLTSLLMLIHSAGQTELKLKLHILKSLLFVLRESHRVRLAFRRVGGFLYVVSLLVTMEGSLATQPEPPWNSVDSKDSLELLRVVFKVITIAMRFEPANAKFFQCNVRYFSLTESLLLLGCFGDKKGVVQASTSASSSSTDELLFDIKKHGKVYNRIFLEDYETGTFVPAYECPEITVALFWACCVIRMLYDMALDNFEKPCCLSSSSTTSTSANNNNSPVHSTSSSNSALYLVPVTDNIIVHPGAVTAILQLLPAIQPLKDSDGPSLIAALSLQIYVMEVVKSLVRSERNQQVMCEAGLPRDLFAVGSSLMLTDNNHPLLTPLYYMVERLAAQSMHPREIREFLRIDMPLCCRDLSDDRDTCIPGEGGPVRLSRMKTLVSMMTPRDYRIIGVTQTPPFVELDMSVEGFGCIYLPSIAPQGVGSSSVNLGSSGAHNNSGHFGGLGTGERIFPPLTGLTFLTWLFVERFSDPNMDPHPIRLLTVVRTVSSCHSSASSTTSPHGQKSHSEERISSELACLTIQLSPADKSLIISTNESDTPGADLDRDCAGSSDCCVRLSIPELQVEKQWCHLGIVLNRAVLKNSTVFVYVNGVLHSTTKLHYVIQNPGGGAVTLSQALSVNAIIGTQPGALRKQSRLLWRLGTTHMLEEAWNQQLISNSFKLGPQYKGSFQSPVLGNERLSVLVPEERVVFGINAQSISQLTLAKLRKIYNKTDSRIIGKLMGISTHDNSTPIRLMHNSAVHLNGPARSIGGVLIGYLGMRSFCPRPISRLLESVGGTSCLLGLIAMANESEGLYAAVKAMLCAVRNNREIAMQLNRIRGYQTVAVLLKEKYTLLNSHILHLIFSLVGTLDSCRDATSIPNTQAFDDLLCNLELWRKTSPDLQRLLFEHFYELLTESSDQQSHNLQTVRTLGLLPRLLHVLRCDPQTLDAARDIVFNLIAAILQPPCDGLSLLKFGQFVASTLENSGGGAGEKRFPADTKALQDLLNRSDSSENAILIRSIYMRNRCLSVLLNILSRCGGNMNFQMCELVLRFLGFDWVFQFFGPCVHDGSVSLALRILLCLLCHQPLLQKFRVGSGNGGWLSDAESVVQNRAGVLLGFSVSAHGGSVGSACDINPEICHAPGFNALSLLLPFHSHLPDVYLSVLALLVGQPSRELPLVVQFDMDSIWTHVFHIASNHSVADGISRIELCTDAVSVLVAVAKRCLHTPPTSKDAALMTSQYPLTLLQFLTFLYHNVAEFTSFCMTEECLTVLISALFANDQQQLDNVSPSSLPAAPTVESSEEQCAPAVDSGQKFNAAARKAIMDFLRSILVDSLPQSPVSKSNAVIDIIIEMLPENAIRSNVCEYITSLLTMAVDHILASDALLHGSTASLPAALTSSSNYSTLAANLFYFTSRLVDCLWNGLFTGDAQNVFQFILKLISQGKRKGGLALDSLFQSLNRTTLFLLSRGVDSLEAQSFTLETLQRLAANRSVIFGQSNYDLDFFACLSYLLFQLTVSPSADSNNENIPLSPEQQRMHETSAVIASAARRVWEEMYVAKKQGLEEYFKLPLVPEINAARSLVGEAVNRAWQHNLETELKGSFSRDAVQIHAQLQSKIQKVAGGITRLASRKTLDIKPTSSSRSSAISFQTLDLWMKVHLSLIRELVRQQWIQCLQSYEHIEKYVLEEWHTVEQELTRERGLWGPNKGSALDKWMLDNTEGPFRMRKKFVRNDMFYIHYPFRPNLDLAEFRPLKCKVAVSRDSKSYYECMRSRRPRTLDPRIIDNSKTILTPSEEKLFLLRDLKDLNPSIIRRFSMRYHSSSDTATSLSLEDDGDSASLASSKGAANSQQLAADIKENTSAADIKENTAAADIKENAADTVSICSQVSVGGTTDSVLSKNVSQDRGDEEEQGTSNINATDADGGSAMQNDAPTKPQNTLSDLLSTKGPDNQTLLRLLEEGEELQSMFRCARVNGLETREGLLLFGMEHYYIVDGYTLLKTKEIRDLDFLPEDLHDPIIPYMATGGTKAKGLKRQCSKFAYEDIREVHRRRYLLQPIALEVFSADGRNYLLAFPKRIRNKVYSKFLSAAKCMISDTEQSVSGQKITASVEGSGGLLSNLIGETSVTQRWVRCEISNFQYLMALNTLAGRSYNDLMQYPVFPWVLANYDSEEFDLMDPATFRDLSKPMGAQTSERLEQFLKRYREWDDPTGETPPYMYGTHYSSAMIVVSYLVRMEPFSQQFLKLQGGHFDLADRMFHSIREIWYSASKNNMADVKELIPEFFYLPDFLVNSNNFDFGAKQSGIVLHDVMLPPWAKGDPREFIRLHRDALESDYISAHLHEWIDLIFGYKQQGPAAVESNNVFHHLFYEGNVDIEAIEDPLTRNATIGFINNFGQIPSQLFKKPHPAKRIRAVEPTSALSRGITSDRLFFHCLDILKPPAIPIKELKGPVGQIINTEKGSLCAVEQNKVLLPPNFTKYLAWGFADHSIRLGSYDSDRSVCISELSDCCGQIVCAVCPNSRTIITGETSTVVNVWEITASGRGHLVSLRLRKTLYGHTESVSCLAASAAYGIVASGSQDCSCIIWDLAELTFIRQLNAHPYPVSAVAINEVTGDIATAAGTLVYLWTVNGQLLANVNTATSPKLDSKQLVLCVAFSTLNEWDPQHVLMTGSNNGVVRMWSLDYIQFPEESLRSASEADDAATTVLASSDRDESSLNAAALRQFNPETLRLKLLSREGAIKNDCAGLSYAPSPDNVNSPGNNLYSEDSDSGLGTPVTGRYSSSRDDREDSECSTPGGRMQKQGSADSFMFVNKDGLAVVKAPNRLKTGFKWQRQLMFRSKLTMHTSFERKDNQSPAAITSIAPSRDHKTLYVGDARGRVWAWSVVENINGRADHWIQDPSKQACTSCQQRFSFSERRHHCRNCGQIFCAKCSRFESEIKQMKISKPVRVCQQCYIKLRGDES